MLQHLPQYLMTRVSDCSVTLQVPTVCRSATSNCCSCPQVVHVSVFFKSFPSPLSSSNRPGSSGSQRRTLSSGLSSSRHFPWRCGSSYLQHQGRLRAHGPLQILVHRSRACFHSSHAFIYRCCSSAIRLPARYQFSSLADPNPGGDYVRHVSCSHDCPHTQFSCCSGLCEGPIRYERPCGWPVDRIWLCIVHP
ncbi:hypothetical protein DFH08DRAFT_833486, partial [Mycena albidolilacea]